MVIARTRLLLLTCLSAFAVAAVACKTSEEASSSADTTSSELVVDPTESSKSVTIKTEDGACTDIRSLIEGNHDALEGLCEGSRIPMPRVSDADACELGQAKSITFECFDAKAPPAIAKGCKKLPVNDRKKAIVGKARRHVTELPGLVCHRIGGWAGPNSHAPLHHPPMPGAEDGKGPPSGFGDGGGPPRGFGDGGGPPSGFDGGVPKPPMGSPGKPGNQKGADGKDEDFIPEIECCAPGSEDDFEGGPHAGGPGGDGPKPPQQGGEPANASN